MPRDRTTPRRPPVLPPKNAEEGAALIRTEIVQLFDKGDGNGADWKLLLESLYKLGFALVDERPDDDARRRLMWRVHEGSQLRLTGGFADGSGETASAPLDRDASLAAMAGSSSPVLKPRH